MTSSSLRYEFPSPRDETLALHESLSLLPLGLSGKGAPCNNGQIYLRQKPARSGTVLADLMADTYVYSGRPCIEGNEWALNFSEAISMILCIILILHSPVISSESVTFVRDHSRHTCLGYWFYRRFSGDIARPSTSISYDDDSSGGEALTESEDDTAINENDNEVNCLSIF